MRTPGRAKHATHFKQIPVALVKKLLRQRGAELTMRGPARHNSLPRPPKGRTSAGKSH